MRARATVSVAVLGTGSIGTQHLAVLRTIEGVQPLAIPRRTERIAALAAAGYRTAPDLPEAVGMGATLAVIATDSGRHRDDGLAALETGLDILVEKPLATNAPDAAQLARSADKAGRRLFVGCVLRCSESLGVFRKQLHHIGRVHTVRIDCHSYLPAWRRERPYRESYSARAHEGGVLRDLVHEIDYAGWIFGWPTAVQARLRNLGRLGIEAEEAADLAWITADGCVVSVSLDYLTRPPRRSMRAAGELGTVEWNGLTGTVTLALADEPETVFRSTQTRNAMLLEQDLAFIAACRDGEISDVASGMDGVRALAVCDAARCASESRREEPVICP
jgi:predicted dehydrogenase